MCIRSAQYTARCPPWTPVGGGPLTSDVAQAPRQRAFTLIELIVALVAIGILATIAVLGYTTFTHRARVAAAQANLTQIATAVMVQHTEDGATNLNRVEFLTALDGRSSVTVVDGLSAANSWTFYGKDKSVTRAGDFAVGFDSGEGTPSNDVAGNRAVITTDADGEMLAEILRLGDDSSPLLRCGAEVAPGATPSAGLRARAYGDGARC